MLLSPPVECITLICLTFIHHKLVFVKLDSTIAISHNNNVTKIWHSILIGHLTNCFAKLSLNDQNMDAELMVHLCYPLYTLYTFW